MQLQQIQSLLHGKGPSMDTEEFVNLVKIGLSSMDDEDVHAILEGNVPEKATLTQQEYMQVFGEIKRLKERLEDKGKESTRFLFNSLLSVQKGKVYTKSVNGIVQIDANSDFKDILGEQFYRKLINYGSNGLLFQKIEQNPAKSYSFFHWIQNRVDIPINQQGDSLYLQLLKRVWLYRFVQALETLQKIKIAFPSDNEIPTVQIGLSFFKQIHQIITQNQELKQVFIDRKEFNIKYEDNHSNKNEVKDFNQKITEIKERLNFNANYFSFIKKDLKNRFYFAIACFLSNREDNYIKFSDQTINIQEVSITDRFFYAKRFYRLEDFEDFKKNFIENFASFWKLDYILLFGTRKESEVILQNYIDETNEIQKAALVSVYLKLFLEQGKIGLKDNKIAFYNRFIKHYEFLLINMDLGISKHKFDQKCITIQVERKKKTMNKTFSFNCSNCKNGQCLLSITKRIKDDLKQHQLRMKGNNYFSKDIRNQVMYCLHCMYMLPKCAVCLFPITVYNGYAEELKKNSLVSGNNVKNCGENLSNSIVWCPKCFHGGHYSHIMRWMQRGQKKCPVFSCKCKCSL